MDFFHIVFQNIEIRKWWEHLERTEEYHKENLNFKSKDEAHWNTDQKMDWATGVFNGDRESHWVSKPFSLIDYCCSKCIIYEHLLVPKPSWPSRPYPFAYVITLFTELKWMNGVGVEKLQKLRLLTSSRLFIPFKNSRVDTHCGDVKLCGRVRFVDTIGHFT